MKNAQQLFHIIFHDNHFYNIIVMKVTLTNYKISRHNSLVPA